MSRPSFAVPRGPRACSGGERLVAPSRSEDHPGVLFARRQRIWDDDGALFDVISVVDGGRVVVRRLISEAELR
jgi:hypothetical protein